MQLVRPRGVIVMKTMIATAHRPPRQTDMNPAVRSEVTVLGSGLGAVGGGGLMREALEMIRRREVDVASLIARRHSLDDGAAAMKTAAQAGVLSVLLS
jgi:threonine dehydrogenase-like Zn-dependent dehydrogenase